jgi:hypothetical protein
LWWRLKHRLLAHTARCPLPVDSWSWTDVLVDWLEPAEWLCQFRNLNRLSACILTVLNLVSTCLKLPMGIAHEIQTESSTSRQSVNISVGMY